MTDVVQDEWFRSNLPYGKDSRRNRCLAALVKEQFNLNPFRKMSLLFAGSDRFSVGWSGKAMGSALFTSA